MKNPFYNPAAAEPVQQDDADRLAERVREYLQGAPAAAEVPDAKVRRLHPKLAVDKVWELVREKVSGEAPRKRKGE